MGDAKRRRQQCSEWPRSESHRDVVDLHILPPVAEIDGEFIRRLTGNDDIPSAQEVILRAFRAVAGERTFHAGFCLGDGQVFSPIGIAVIERLMMETPGAALHVVPIVDEDIAWDIVLRHLRTFAGKVLLFAFPDSDIYDAGTAEISYSPDIRQFDDEGRLLRRSTAAQRHRIRERKAAMLGRPSPPRFLPVPGQPPEDAPWIFRIGTPAGKVIRAAVWNGRRNYAHEMPDRILHFVGGDRIAVVQVDSPVGVDRRSSLDLTHHLAADFDGVIHWARDTATFRSILGSFIRLDLESVPPPELPEDWDPEVTFFPANPSGEKDLR
ncbi:hypothetical protein [Methylobacterium brachythecii]|uniref:Uncharacterized protein n=1 Tax=Methylobacterium brachythecii TaxID=1176177 RepID=A0A7W6F884_9HYPH|nr:hypothetical protein [Methylobacterium brachythecii]MBB3904130.1 hypothetical protein [Methylobacterium brachythecii]GLS42872.1 hypothetical protein GCM10007884_08570 [Methylobacterium brachythecii]